MRSAFDDYADTIHPTPGDHNGPAKGLLPRVPPMPTLKTTLSIDDLFSFINRSMTLRGSLVFWKRDNGRDLVPQLWGRDCEVLLSFRVDNDRQVVRHADVAWMLVHGQKIPDGHAVVFSDGNPANRDTHNLWLTKID